MVRSLRQRIVHNGFTWLGLAFYLLVAVFPIYWMFLAAFKTDFDLVDFENFPFWFNEAPTLDHVTYLFTDTKFATWLMNTMEVSGVAVIITLLVCVPGAYALARLRFPAAENFGIGIFMTYLVPPSILFLGLSRVMVFLHLQDNKWGLGLIYPTITVPFCMWLMMGFFKTVPIEIEEAAWVDGCTRLQGIFKVLLPISVAGLLTVTIFAFTLAMQDFLYALAFMSSSDQKTMTVGVVTDLIRGDVYFWGSLMAGAFIAGIPVAILYNFFLDHFVQGITGGAVK